MNTPNRWGLTDRQYEVTQLVAQGLTNPEVAAALNLSLDTVKTHARIAYSKLGVSNRIQATHVFTETATGSTLRQEINFLSRRLARIQDTLHRLETRRAA